MSGETEREVSGWTTDTLKSHIDRRFEDQEKAVAAALEAAKEAVIKAEAAAEKRFDSVNEFRKSLSDQTATFIPRNEYDVQHKSLEARVQEVVDRLNTTQGQGEGSQITMSKIYAAIGGVGAILAILVLLANGIFK